MFPHPTDFYTGVTRAGHVETWFLVGGLGLFFFPALFVFAITRARFALRQARAAAEAEGRGERSLASGPTVLYGKVVSPEVAVLTLRVRQVSDKVMAQRTDGRTRHVWREVARTLEASPFDLALSSGVSVHVEPGTAPVYAGPLSDESMPGDDRRTLVGTVKPGEHVFVEGELTAGATGGAYRADSTPTLRPGTRPLLLSQDPLEQRYGADARSYQRLARVLAVLAGVLHLGVFGTFWVATLFGTASSAEVIDIKSYMHVDGATSRGPGASRLTSTRYRAELRDGAPLDVSTNELYEFRTAQQKGRTAMLPVLELPLGLGRMVGTEPSVHENAWMFAIALAVLAMLFVGAFKRRPPWWERPKLNGEGSRSDPFDFPE
jgi:hypothetical protein